MSNVVIILNYFTCWGFRSPNIDRSWVNWGKSEFLFHVAFTPEVGESRGQVAAVVGERGQGQPLLLASFTHVFAHTSIRLPTSWKHVYSDHFKNPEVRLFVLSLIRSLVSYSLFPWVYRSCPFLNTACQHLQNWWHIHNPFNEHVQSTNCLPGNELRAEDIKVTQI